MKQIDDGLTLFTERHEEACNVYRLEGNGDVLFVDTGLFCDEIENLRDTKRAIITHAHFDHVGGNYLFNEILMYPLSEERLSLVWKEADLIEEEFDIVKTIPKKIRHVSDGEIVQCGNINLQVIHTPGHTPDSISLYEPNKKWLFTGDLFYRGNLIALDCSNLDKWKESLIKISTLETRFILTGHNEILNKLPSNIGNLINESSVVRIIENCKI